MKGINIDNKLNFDCHVSIISRKAAKQINALQRLCYNTMQYGFRSIIYQSALIWNSLPVELKEVDELVKFKDLLRRCSSLESCNCGSCIICQQINL